MGDLLLLDALAAEGFDAPTCSECRTVLRDADAGRCARCCDQP